MNTFRTGRTHRDQRYDLGLAETHVAHPLILYFELAPLVTHITVFFPMICPVRILVAHLDSAVTIRTYDYEAAEDEKDHMVAAQLRPSQDVWDSRA